MLGFITLNSIFKLKYEKKLEIKTFMLLFITLFCVIKLLSTEPTKQHSEIQDRIEKLRKELEGIKEKTKEY